MKRSDLNRARYDRQYSDIVCFSWQKDPSGLLKNCYHENSCIENLNGCKNGETQRQEHGIGENYQTFVCTLRFWYREEISQSHGGISV